MWTKLRWKKTHLFHFQHKAGRVRFKIIIHTNSGENLISYTARGVLGRNKRAWKNDTTGSLLEKIVKSVEITNLYEVRRLAANRSGPWFDTAPLVWGKWICRSCWVQLWWQSCCPRRCSCCSIWAAVVQFAPEWDDGLAWWPACL